MTSQPESRSVADQLISLEKTSPGLVEAYRREMSALTERKLSTPVRWLTLGEAGIWIVGLILLWCDRQEKLFASNLAAQFTLIAWFGGIGIVLGMLCLSAWGRANRRIVSGVCLLLTVAMVGGQGLLLVNAGFSMEDAVTRRQITFTGVALLVIVGMCIAATVIQEMYQRIEERLLRIELRLAAAAEPVAKPNIDTNDHKT